LVAGSYESNSSARLIRIIAPPSAPPSEEVARSESEKRRFLDALALERFKIADISSAIDLYSGADAVFVTRNRNGISDDAGLGTALAGLHNELSPHKQEDGSSTPDLLDPATLKNLVQQVANVLDKAQSEALSGGLSADQITEKRNQLPKLVSRYQVDALYGQIANLENALRHALKVNLSPQSSYYFRYDRSSDTLSSEQKTLINLAGQQAVSIDVCGTFAGLSRPTLNEQIAIREDSSSERELSPTKCQIPLHVETKLVAVTQRIDEPHASYRLITDQIWIPFRAVPLRWSIPLNSSIILNLRFPENPSINWPLTLTIQTGSSDAISAIFLPHHSFFYADANLKSALAPESDADEDELVPDQGTPKIAELAIDKTIKVELLPRYLSNSVGQRYKQYLVMENLVVSLIIAIVGALCLAIVSE
jgi:hypothetical protein